MHCLNLLQNVLNSLPQQICSARLTGRAGKKVLRKDEYKDIIIRSMRFLVENKRVIIYGFMIMPNHIHIVWQMQAGQPRENVQRDFLKFTAQRINDRLKVDDAHFLSELLVEATDRKYQVWKRNPLSVDLWSEKVMVEKLRYRCCCWSPDQQLVKFDTFISYPFSRFYIATGTRKKCSLLFFLSKGLLRRQKK